MTTSSKRREIRLALDGLGFKRLNATLDKGDGVYSELFSDQDDNCLTITWTERTPEPEQVWQPPTDPAADPVHRSH